MGSILVLGGTSWVGGEIARAALARGHDVTCLARGESGDAPSEVIFVRADRTEADAYAEVAEKKWDVVVDVSRQPGHVRSAIAALGDTAAHWVFVSTGSVYADQSVPLIEDSPLLDPLTDEVAGPEQYGEGKVACEAAVREHPNHLIVRAGLIGGPGDRSDRLGYYVSRCALAEAESVLVPDVPGQPMQVIDVRDLAQWIIAAAEARATGIVRGVGERTTVGELIAVSATAAGFTGNVVSASEQWLHDHDVQEWMGPRSLPLWLPETHHGMGMMDDARAVELGLRRRPIAETIHDTLVDERAKGLGRDRQAGLSRSEELELLHQRI